MDDVDVQFLRRFFDFADIPLIILVGITRSWILGKIDVKIVHYIGKELQLYSCAKCSVFERPKLRYRIRT
jgi:hypothetical protein